MDPNGPQVNHTTSGIPLNNITTTKTTTTTTN